MDRRCAGALLALAACIAGTAAAPTASNQTALDLYDEAPKGCYYNFQHYGEGDRIMTNEPCLNCTCHNRMLMCYLRVCPFTKPIGQDCSVEKRADQCCPIVTCPDVPVDLLTSTSTTSPAEYGETGLGKLDRYGCSINGKYFPEGAKVPPTPSKPCEHCYCIRNMTTCVMQECTLHVDGCTPIYHKDVCCPVRYSCDHPEDEIPLLDDMTTTVRPTPGFLLTTTTLSPVTQMTQDCVHDDKVFADGALIKTEKACEHCYCMKGDIVCVVQECGTPMENEGKNCTSMPPREGQCCPDTYICEGDEFTTETKSDFTTLSSSGEITTLTPPRRVNVEGSGYRKEPGEPFTEEPAFEPDTEGSGQEEEPFKPIDGGETLVPESETPKPFITTENDDNIDQYSSSTSRIPVVDSELIDKATTEPDKGENTVPSGSIDEGSSEMSISDKTTPEETKLATEPGLTTESYFDAKTTAIHEDESSITDIVTTKAEASPTKLIPISETTIADYQSPSSPDDNVTVGDESLGTTEPTQNKQDDESSTLKDKEGELTTKASDFIAPDTLTTETIPSFIEHEAKTTTSQLPEQENEVLIKEPTTETYLESSTKPDIIKTETETATTIQPEIVTELSTPGKEHMQETTSVNPVDNEIDEESYPTPSQGRIPGEGDCLLDGVTYSNESIVPSSNNCHTSCRCVSSIVKCDPIICSAPPDYMDNCQPMYDPPESCCPTYVCDHTRETVPPQSHSQMSGTESPVPTPTVECNGDQCDIIKDKEDSMEPTGPCTSEACSYDSSKKPEKCGTEGCKGINERPDHESHPSVPTEECAGEKCTSPQAHCVDGKCGSPPTTDQICDSENGCEIPVDQACQGEDCKAQTEVSPVKDGSAPCDNTGSCKDGQDSERVPDCDGESCTSKTGPKATEGCKDGSDCTRPDQSPTLEECNEEGCKRKEVSDISKPATGECTDSNCISQDNLPQITNVPESITESAPTEPEESVTDSAKTTDVDKEMQPRRTTEASIFVKDDETESTTHYDEKEKQKDEELQPSITDTPELYTQAQEVQQYDRSTEATIQEETTEAQIEDMTNKTEIILEATFVPTEESSTSIPKLTENATEDGYVTIPGTAEKDLSESVIKPTEQPLVDRQTMVPQEDITSDKQEYDLTTASPSVPVGQDVTIEIGQDSTESQAAPTSAPEYPDKDRQDVTTKEPEYVQEQDEIRTESPSTIGSLDEVTEPESIHKDSEPNVTGPAESATSASEKTSTEKPDEELVEQEPFTTPKSYDGQTNAPEKLETKAPAYDVSEEQADSNTVAPEKLSTLSQEQEKEKKETELPVSIVTSDEPISKPDHTVSVTEGMLTPDDETGTKSPIKDDTEITAKPEFSLSDSDITRAPESTATFGEELITTTPIQDVTDELPESHVTQPQEITTEVPKETVVDIQQEIVDESLVTPSEISDKSQIPTEAPMSIVNDETRPTQTSEISGAVAEQNLTTQTSDSSESPVPHSTESYSTETEQISSPKPEVGETMKDHEKIPDSRDEEHADAATEKVDTSIETTLLPVLVDESTEQPIKEYKQPEVPTSDASTDKTPVTVSIVAQTELPESVTTDSGVLEPGVPGEENTEMAPGTSIPSENIDTKSPESFTEIPTQSLSEDNEITTTEDQSGEKENVVTEIPELTIHEHTESILTTEEPKQSVMEETATKAPDMSATEPQEISTQQEATRVPNLQDSITNAPDISAIESQTEVTEAPEQEFVTPEHPPTETTGYEAPKDVTTTIPEISATESQKEATGTPEVHDATTEIPEVHVSEPQKEVTHVPVSLDITTSALGIAVTDVAKEVTETPESQDSATNIPDKLATGTHSDVTEAPELQATIIPETFEKEPHKESTEAPDSLNIATNVPEIIEPESPKESTESQTSQDITTKIPEIFETAVTGQHEEPSEQPEPQDTATKVPEFETHKEVTEIPESPDTATSVPKISVTEPQEEASEVPEIQETATKVPDKLATDDAASNIPEIFITESQKTATESPEAPNVATDIPETLTTESQKELTETPVLEDATTNIPETHATESQKEVTEAPVGQDVDTNIPETHATESQKEVTEAPVGQDVDINIPETLATESQEEVTETPVGQDVDRNIPETIATESQKEVTETPVAQDVTANIPGTSKTEAPELQVITTNIPETLATESAEKEVTEIPVVQDVATNIPEAPVTESQKELTEAPVVQDVATNISEATTTESQNELTEAPVKISETDVTESQKEVTEGPVAQDVTINISETLATESEKEVTETPVVQDLATNLPETPVTESQMEVTEAPVVKEVATNIPETPVTESQMEVTEVSVVKEVATNVPETPVTESQMEVTEVATPTPETSTTESKKEGTRKPESHDTATYVPVISEIEPQKETTEVPEAQKTNIPDITPTETLQEATVVPEVQDAATKVPEISATESQKEVTDTPEVHDIVTEISDEFVTEPQKTVTEIPEIQDTATKSELPEIVTSQVSTSEPQKELGETPEQDFVTRIPERTQTEANEYETKLEESDVTEKEEVMTEVPLKVTTKLDDHTESGQIQDITQTESPKYDTPLPSEGGLLNEQSTNIPESLVTESLDKATDLDVAIDKPKDKEKLDTELPIVEPTMADEHLQPEKSDTSTELPISSESVEPDIKSPQSSESDSDITKTPESPVTEKQSYITESPENEPQGEIGTEATNKVIEQEDDTVTKSPDQLEPLDKTTKISEEPEKASDYPETTPYLVLLEEHTHKKDIFTMSPDEEITTGASDVPSDYEVTPEVSIDKVTESAPGIEIEKPSQEESVPTEKDEAEQVTEAKISDKMTEPSLLSEEITTISPTISHVTEEVQLAEKPQDLESNEISTAAPGEEQKETDKPLTTSVQDDADKIVPSVTDKTHETTAPEEEFILATTKATTIKTEEELATPSLVDKYGKPDEAFKPASEPEIQKPDITDEIPKPGINEVQTTEEAPQPDFPPSGTSGYGQESDYGEEDQAFGPGTCRYGGKVYVSAQQIPRDDPCDFCFCFRSDIICLQQSCPPPIHGCHEEPIQGFCCPRYECPVSMATTLNVTTTTTTTTTTLPPHFLPHAYKGAAQRRGCQIKGHTYKVGEVVRASSGPCLHCTCGGDGQMKCDPKVCTPEPMLRQMIAAAVSAKRRR